VPDACSGPNCGATVKCINCGYLTGMPVTPGCCMAAMVECLPLPCARLRMAEVERPATGGHTGAATGVRPRCQHQVAVQHPHDGHVGRCLVPSLSDIQLLEVPGVNLATVYHTACWQSACSPALLLLHGNCTSCVYHLCRAHPSF